MKTSGIGTMATRTTPPVRTLIADDSPLMVQILTRILTETNRYEIVGTATDGTQALRLAHTLHPGLILMDYRMPDPDGIQATKCIKTFEDPPVIVVITSDDNPGLRSMARDAGANGFLLKGEDIRRRLTATLRELFDSGGARKRTNGAAG